MTTRLCASRVGLVLLALALFAAPVAAQQERSLCADCHFANLGGPSPRHLADWESSPHGRNNIGCERCHGGNSNTVEAFPAHQAIVHGNGLDNPVNRRNLPRTCGGCHAGPFAEFQSSKHFTLLRNGDPDAPTCSTCHGEVAANLLSPKGLENQCNACHGRGKEHARPEYGANARLLLTQVRDARTILNYVKPLIERVKDEKLRTSLQADYGQAQVPLNEAIHAGHSFVFDNMQERLTVAIHRAEALSDRLANPGATPSSP
jgi:hypothetical protein